MIIVENEADLAPLISSVVLKTIEAMREADEKMGDKLAFDEKRGADLISLSHHQLRDIRLTGGIGSTKIVGGRIRYTRKDLMEYLAKNWTAARV